MAEKYCVSHIPQRCEGCIFAQNGVAEEYTNRTDLSPARVAALQRGMSNYDPSAYDTKDRLQKQGVSTVAEHFNRSPEEARRIIQEHCPKYQALQSSATQ